MGAPCMRYAARSQATNIFFENAYPFEQNCEHTAYSCCNCTRQNKICQFLHEHEENIVHILDMFLH